MGKDKDHKKKSSKDKKEKKGSKDKKSKKKSKHSHRDTSSSDDQMSELDRERAAANGLRDLLWLHPPMKKDLRELLWTVDQGKVADISQVPDPDVKSRIKLMFEHLSLRKINKGVYQLSHKATPTLSVLGFVFDELARPSSISPAPEPVKVEISDSGGSSSDSEEERETTGEAEEQSHPWAMVPSAELLAAAASAAAMQRAYEEQEAGGRGSCEIPVGPIPPEMYAEAEQVPQNEREAEVEVMRIMATIHDAERKKQAEGKAPLSGPPSVLELDAYAVIGLENTCTGPEVKKRYMRLSLLIHPDKCSHKDAHDAFQAVSKASKLLQDPDARKVLDDRLEEAKLRKAANAMAEQHERDRAWRIAKGEEDPCQDGNSGMLVTLPPEMRANALASQLSLAHQVMMYVNVTSFSRNGKKGRGDTSEWTDTPQLRAEKDALAALGFSIGGTLALTASGPSAPSNVAASMLDSFNAKKRKKTLMEEHQERQEQEAKQGKKKKDKKGDKGGEGSEKGAGDKKEEESWVGKHPWRPFDRDTDLVIKPKALDPKKLMEGGMAGMFQSAGGTRHFL
eukprot:gene30369-35375_t